MKIDIVHPGYYPLHATDFDSVGLGGNDTGMVLAARGLARRGHQVRVFAHCDPHTDQGVTWLNLHDLYPREHRDVVIFWVRTRRVDASQFNAPVRVAKLGLKKPNIELLAQVQRGEINLLLAFSSFQRDRYCQRYHFPAEANWVVTADGLDISYYPPGPVKQPGKVLHAANPDRGLKLVLDVWPAIRQRHPEATLTIASSYLLRGISAEEDLQKGGHLYERARRMSGLGVAYLGRLSKPELIRHQLSAQVYLYPTTYEETCCIAALEAAAASEVIICSPSGALPDRVRHGVTGLLISGDPADPPVRDRFAAETVRVLNDRDLLTHLAAEARILAQTHDYTSVLTTWEDSFARLL